MYPFYSFMKKKLSFKPAFSATVITFVVFSIIILIFSFVTYLFVSEIINLYHDNIVFFKKIFTQNNIFDLLSGMNISGDMFFMISNTAFGIVKIVPVSITLLIVSFVFTIYLINNVSDVINSVSNKLSDKNSKMFKRIIDKSRYILRKFVKSYIILYCITFVESLFIFVLIDLDYPLVFAFLTAISDVLPVFGPGTVYIPLAVIKLLYGDFLSAVTLGVFWIIVLLIRQIIEPKILSDTIKINPLIILSALYFSIVSSSIWVLFFIILLTLTYKILVEASVLSPVFSVSDKDNSKDC